MVVGLAGTRLLVPAPGASAGRRRAPRSLPHLPDHRVPGLAEECDHVLNPFWVKWPDGHQALVDLLFKGPKRLARAPAMGRCRCDGHAGFGRRGTGCPGLLPLALLAPQDALGVLEPTLHGVGQLLVRVIGLPALQDFGVAAALQPLRVLP